MDRAAVTTYLRGNHAVRLEDWRYIRYSDGGEELYNTSEDPDERHNLISDPGYTKLALDLQPFLPETDAPEVRGKNRFAFNYDSYSWRNA